jgi:DNA-binding beta-propeller fold protein YncE
VPLAVDGGSDGRVYALDAGNSRVQVFDRSGDYITQIGDDGAGPGEFNFGSGSVPEDFAGSLAVDDEGYIYVADVLNNRIQRFGP